MVCGVLGRLPTGWPSSSDWRPAWAAWNPRLAAELSAAFVVTLGDEFQGWARHAGAAVPVLAALDEELGDLPVRYALGWGALTTHLRQRR
jgi:hypothetical protein